MKEYVVMLFVFMGTLFLFGWFLGSLIIAWIIIGRAALHTKGVSLAHDGIASYPFYLAWPFYLVTFKTV
nr:hypothetical protein [Alteromonas macleodii]|tara:strand:+ start:3384 stop:3590 length:207 start_codon:yes stop_codon:yes gene_type:complete